MHEDCAWSTVQCHVVTLASKHVYNYVCGRSACHAGEVRAVAVSARRMLHTSTCSDACDVCIVIHDCARVLYMVYCTHMCECGKCVAIV